MAWSVRIDERIKEEETAVLAAGLTASDAVRAMADLTRTIEQTGQFKRNYKREVKGPHRPKGGRIGKPLMRQGGNQGVAVKR